MTTAAPGRVDVCRLANDLDGGSVAAALGLEHRKGAERDKRRCPGCGSSDALHVYPAPRGLFCYSCGAVRSNVDAAAAALGVSPVDAARWLLEHAGGSAPLDVDRPTRRRVAEDLDEPARRRLALAWSAVLRGPLGHGLAARDWLRGRRLEPDPRAEPWPPWHGVYGDDLHGVSGEDWPKLLAALVAAGAEAEDLERAGLTGPKCRAWHRNPWLVALYRDPSGAPDGVRLRGLYSQEQAAWFEDRGERVPKWLSLRSPFTVRWPWRAERAAAARVLIVTEGETDTLSVELAVRPWPGVAVLGAPGAATWRSAWGELLGTAARVLILADNDDSGEGAAVRIADSAPRPDLVNAQRVARGGCKDCNDLWHAGRLRAALAEMGVPAW